MSERNVAEALAGRKAPAKAKTIAGADDRRHMNAAT